MHSPPSTGPEGSAENGAAETSAEKGAGAFSLSSGVTTAPREVARGENLAEARFRRALGPPIYLASSEFMDSNVTRIPNPGHNRKRPAVG